MECVVQYNCNQQYFYIAIKLYMTNISEEMKARNLYYMTIK